MLDKGLLQELNEAFVEMADAEGKVRDICRRIAESDAATGIAEPPKAKRGGRKPKERTQAPAGGGKDEGKKEYWIKVKCQACGRQMGSRVIGTNRFPINHKDAEGNRCRGIFMTAREAGEDAES